MSSQKFSASQREAIWLAHEKKCAYTREPLDVSSFHIDHIIPESLVDDPVELKRVRTKLGLAEDFDVNGYENLLPCRPGANLQKGDLVFDLSPANFFLAIAASKVEKILANLERIEKRNVRGKALILLQQCLERGDLSASEVGKILEDYDDHPEEIFTLIEGMQFADASEVRTIAKMDIDLLLDRPIRFGQNDNVDSVIFVNDRGEELQVRTCREYSEAVEGGYFPASNFEFKMAAYLQHQCGLLEALKSATAPRVSFINNPRVGILDLSLMPFSLFPNYGEGCNKTNSTATYQDKVNDGSIAVTKIRQNLLQVAEPEGMGQQLIEVARADFNGDGIEDILIFEFSWATHGTFGISGVHILTRKSVEGKFERIIPAVP